MIRAIIYFQAGVYPKKMWAKESKHTIRQSSQAKLSCTKNVTISIHLSRESRIFFFHIPSRNPETKKCELKTNLLLSSQQQQAPAYSCCHPSRDSTDSDCAINKIKSIFILISVRPIPALLCSKVEHKHTIKTTPAFHLSPLTIVHVLLCYAAFTMSLHFLG